MKKRIDLNGIELDRDYSTPKRFWNACKTVLKNHGIEIEDIFYTYEEWIKPSNPSIAHTNEDGSASENVSCRYHVYCPYRDEVDRGYNYILQYEDGHGYMYVLTDGYEMIEYEGENEKTENNKNEMESKTMKNTTVNGITLEIATSAHVAHAKANMSTEKPEIIEVHDLNEKSRIESHCNFKMYDPEKINIHIGYKPVISHDFTKEKSVIKSVAACKRIINILCLPSESVMHDTYEKTLEKKKADYLLNLKKIADNKKAKEDNEKRLASERAKQNLEKLASHKYKSESVIDSIDKAIKERKPERLNIYSTSANTLDDLTDSKTLIKNANTALKTIKNNISNKKAISEKFITEIKRCTLRREFIGYAKRFKQSFIKIVNAEYSEKTKNIYKYKKTVVKQSAKKPAKFKLEKTPLKLFYLTCKKSRLAKKIADLDKKINACISVINQLEKIDINKINYNLIATKLQTIGGFDTDECTLVKIQAVKNQLANTLHNTMSALDNIENRIDVIKNIDTAYSKIKNGNEIVIDITTNQLVNNVYFRICCGYNCTNDNSTSALLHIRKLVEKTMQSINISGYNAEINYNVFENVNTILSLAKQITKRQSFNMIQRQGSKTQYQIYYACMRNNFEDHDVADIYSTAYTQILTCLSVKNPAILLKVKNVLSALNAKIQHLNYTIDIDKIKKYVFTANNFLKYEINHTDILATRDYNKNKRLITLLENMYNAVKNKNVTALKTSVYNAINEYLTSIRSIRENDKMTLNLDDYINRMSNADYNADNETLVTNPYADNDNTEIKRKILFECYKNVKKCINNSTAKTFDLMCKGYTEIQISEKRKIDRKTIAKHVTDIKTAFLKAYSDIKQSDNTEIKQAFENNVIVFDPSVFADCRSISEKTEKIVNTYERNTEFEKLSNIIDKMHYKEFTAMKDSFKKFLSTFDDKQKTIFIKLLDNKSTYEIAESLQIDRGRVKRIREKSIKTAYKIIEEYTKTTVNKEALKKAVFADIISLFEIA